jgi:hypothetical protein
MGNQDSYPTGKQIDHPKFRQIDTDIRNRTVYMVPTFSVINEQIQEEWEQKLLKTNTCFKNK